MLLSGQLLRGLAFTLAATIALAGVACNGGGGGGEVKLQGAGATFPNPLYQKWISEYGKLHANVKIDYQSIGSGGGIKQLQAQTVDFGASDAPMNEDEIKGAPGPDRSHSHGSGRSGVDVQPGGSDKAAAVLA